MSKFKEIVFKSREDAEEVLNRMHELNKAYGLISVLDMHDLAGKTCNYVWNKYGWIDLRTAKVIKDEISGEYSLDLPQFIPLPTDKNNYEMVNHPDHYISETGLETIDVIEAFTFDLKGIEAVDTGNALKYICRWKNKNGVQDLKKAMWYLDHLIKHIEKLEKENEKYEN